MSTSTPVPGPHLSTRPAAVAHTRPLSPSAVRLAPFKVTNLPVGPARKVASSFAELAVDLDELADLGGLALGHAEQALHYLEKAREHALLALDLQPVHTMGGRL